MPWAKMAMRRQLVGHLIQRLKVEDWYRRHPEIGDEPLMPTGTAVGVPGSDGTGLTKVFTDDLDLRYSRQPQRRMRRGAPASNAR